MRRHDRAAQRARKSPSALPSGWWSAPCSKMCAKVSVVTLHALRGSRRRNQHVNPGQLGGFFANALEGRMLATANLEERFVQPVGQAERSWVMTAYTNRR
jgi:hypothetical protein